MPDPLSITGLVATVLQVATSLIQEYRRIRDVPEKLLKFQRSLEEFRSDAEFFERLRAQHNLPLPSTPNLEETLRESERLLTRYSDMFQDRNIVQQGYDALRLHYNDETRLDELSQEINSQYLRFTYRLQLMLQ
jgi:hypothetical protein